MSSYITGLRFVLFVALAFAGFAYAQSTTSAASDLSKLNPLELFDKWNRAFNRGIDAGHVRNLLGATGALGEEKSIQEELERRAKHDKDDVSAVMLGQTYEYTGRWSKTVDDEVMRKRSGPELETLALIGPTYEKDLAQARYWYERAAAQGNPGGQYFLAILEYEGLGGGRNRLGAIENLKAAAVGYYSNGHREAALEVLDKMASYGADKNAIQRLYASFSPNAQTGSNTSVETGTGFFIDSDLVATAAHVVEGVSTAEVVLINGTHVTANIEARDEANDIAILKIQDQVDTKASGQLPLHLRSRQAQLGERVMTVGFPYPELMGKDPKVTFGEINATAGLQGDLRFYQISVPIQPGNSGGALIDEHGNVLGIVVSKLNAQAVAAQSGDIPQNVNYAVKARYLRAIMDDIGERPSSSNESKLTRDEAIQAATKSVVFIRVTKNSGH